MAVTITARIISLSEQLVANYGLDASILKGETFSWDHLTRTITFNATEQYAIDYFLHEASHALLKHQFYSSDIELLSMERAAWDKARDIGSLLGVTITDEVIEASLDTYRDWLHARSLCPHCDATGIQIEANGYSCLACYHRWKVNEARACALRRYIEKFR